MWDPVSRTEKVTSRRECLKQKVQKSSEQEPAGEKQGNQGADKEGGGEHGRARLSEGLFG